MCQGAFAKLSLCHSAPSEDVERWCVVFVEQVYIWRLKPSHPHQVHHKYSHWEHLYQFCYTFKGCWEIHAIHSSKQSPLAVKSNSPKVSNLRVWCELIKGVEGTVIGLPCLLTTSESRIRKMWVFAGGFTVGFQWANNEQQLKPSRPIPSHLKTVFLIQKNISPPNAPLFVGKKKIHQKVQRYENHPNPSWVFFGTSQLPQRSPKPLWRWTILWPNLPGGFSNRGRWMFFFMS